MSFRGNPEIFTLDPTDNTVTRITSSFGFDVDPSWSPDGSKMAFVSSRTGTSMVFSMNADGSHVQRLTYAGVYNATPSWSPRNNKIVFAGMVDHKFDIFTMNPDGTNIERLTKNQGDNEDPYFSPGRKLRRVQLGSRRPEKYLRDEHRRDLRQPPHLRARQLRRAEMV